MAIEVVRVRSRGDLRQFIEFPRTVYRGDSCWVPPLLSEMKKALNPRKNPFFEHAEAQMFLAREEKQVLGRIAAVVNDRYLEVYNEKAGFLALFEVLPKYHVADRLLSTGCDWLRNRGMDTARGPTGFSNTDEFGLLVEGFDERPLVMMPYNPEYYITFLERFGFRKMKEMLTYVYSNAGGSTRVANMIKWLEAFNKTTDVSIRSVNIRELDRGREIFNAAWDKMWTFLPITEHELRYLGASLRPFLDPDLVLVAEVGDKPVGYAIAIPDINQALKHVNGRLFPRGFLAFKRAVKGIDTLRFLNLVVRPEHRPTGIAALLIQEMFQQCVRKAYKKIEISWILEDNSVVRGIFEKAGLEVKKKHALYELPLH